MKKTTFVFTTAALLTICSANAQQTFSYDFNMNPRTNNGAFNGQVDFFGWYGDWIQNTDGLNGDDPAKFHLPSWSGMVNPDDPTYDATDFDTPGGARNKYVGGRITNTAAQNFGATGVNTTSYDLSSIGSSLTIQVGWNPVRTNSTRFPNNQNVNSGGANNQIFQIGLMNGTGGWFGDGTNDAFFLGGLERFYRVDTVDLDGNGSTIGLGDLIRGSTNLDLNVYNEDFNSLHTFANQTFLTREELRGLTADDIDVHFYANTITFTNIDGTNMGIDWNIDRYRYDGFTPENHASLNAEIGETTPNFFSGSTTVAHGLTDLSDLHVGLGLHVEDSLVVSNSGATYDWYSVNPVPEPSTSMLAMFASFFALGIRRRKE